MDKIRHSIYTENGTATEINGAKRHPHQLYSMLEPTEQNLYYNFFFLKRTRRVLIFAAPGVLQAA